MLVTRSRHPSTPRYRTFTLEQVISTFEHAARPEAREALGRLFR